MDRVSKLNASDDDDRPATGKAAEMLPNDECICIGNRLVDKAVDWLFNDDDWELAGTSGTCVWLWFVDVVEVLLNECSEKRENQVLVITKRTKREYSFCCCLV